MPYESWLPKTAPPWLQKTAGKKRFEAIGKFLDDAVDRLKQATKARFPDYGPVDALPKIGRDRQFLRGPSETESAYRTRLREAFDRWKLAGSHRGILLELKGQGFPTGVNGAHVIQHNGVSSYLDGSDQPVFEDTQVCPNRTDLTGVIPTPALTGFTLDLRDQFYSVFCVLFPQDVPALRINTDSAARVNAVVRKWKPAKAIFVGTAVIEAGGAWGWPIAGNLWGNDTNWGADTVHYIPPG